MINFNDILIKNHSALLYENDKYSVYDYKHWHNNEVFNQNQRWYTSRYDSTMPFVVFIKDSQQATWGNQFAILAVYNEIHVCGKKTAWTKGPIWIQNKIIRGNNPDDLELLKSSVVHMAKLKHKFEPSEYRVKLYERMDAFFKFRSYDICHDLENWKYTIRRDWVTAYAKDVNYKLDWNRNPNNFYDQIENANLRIVNLTSNWKFVGFGIFDDDGVVNIVCGNNPTDDLWAVFSGEHKAVLTNFEQYIELNPERYDYSKSEYTSYKIRDQQNHQQNYSMIDRDIMLALFERRLNV